MLTSNFATTHNQFSIQFYYELELLATHIIIFKRQFI